MFHTPSTLAPLVTACLALLATTPASQHPDSDPSGLTPSLTSAISSAFGAHVEGDGVVAGGPDYKAHIRDGELRFTPALGRAVEENQTLTFAFEEIRRGSTVVAKAGAAPIPTLDGNLIRIEHPDGVVEQYEVLREGLLQSFVLSEHPGGTGDLVVRGRWQSPLPRIEATPDGGIAFLRDGIGGVNFGAVTGIDANGALQPGTLRVDGDYLELSLSSDFIDSAAYPLIVDPLIGPDIDIDTSSLDDFDPDVAASSSSSGRYFAVWERAFSIGDIDIRGIRLDGAGNQVGGLLALQSSSTPAVSPAVAHVVEGRRYFVAWQEQPSIFLSFDISGRAVDATDGDMSSTIVIANSGAHERSPDVGGERSLVDNDAFVVWDQSDTGIVGRQVTVPLAGDPFLVGSAVTIADDFGTGDYVNPAISKSGGDAGRYLLAWETGFDGVFYRLINRNGGLIGGAFFLTALLGGPHRMPACAGDGENFMMVWERGEAFPSLDHDVWALSLTYTGSSIVHNDWQPIENNANDEESDPDVVFNGQQYVVTYTDDDGDTHVYAKSVDPFNCLVGENESLVGTAGSSFTPAITSVYTGGLSTNGDVLLTWWNNQDIYGQLYDSPHGQDDLGGACGGGGRATTPCPFDSNDNFTLHLRDADPTAPAFLLLAFQQAPLACGPCTLWPSLANPQVFFPGLTDPNGNTAMTIPLPAGVSGISFTTQWAVLSGTSCDLFGVDLSNGVETTVQL